MWVSPYEYCTVIAILVLCLEPKPWKDWWSEVREQPDRGKITFEGRHPASSLFELHRPPFLQQSHRPSTSSYSRALSGCCDGRHLLQKGVLRVALLTGLRMIIPILPTSRYSPWSYSRSPQYSYTLQIAMIGLLSSSPAGLSVRVVGWLIDLEREM